MAGLMKTYEVRYTEVAQQSVEDQVHYLADFHGVDGALDRIDALLDDIKSKLAQTALAYPSCQLASELGVLHYRELNTSEYRVFYEVDEAAQVVAVGLVLRQIQSVEQALIRYCLLYSF